ncbi:MAG: phage tail protein I, partial [Acutalibacter sp.]|nr:phage tail protein I [Acutalibacter sp.]
MSNEHGLTGENLLRTLPPALAQDETMRALAAAIAGLLAAQPAEIEKLAIFPNIDQMDSPLLDILAQDFKVDWWDSDYSTAEKRRTLSASWQVHKTLGTRAAVEKAASAVYPNTRVQEWFEYGGEPYRFKLDVGLGEFEWDRERHKRLMWGLNFYKNLRSHLEAVEYHVPPVEVENRQAFYLAALLIRLWVREWDGLAQSRLLLGYGARTEAGAALSALRLGAHIAQKEKLAMASLLAQACESQG